eukprot:1293314-Lingulodinium_polyedra.AAC.1
MAAAKVAIQFRRDRRPNGGPTSARSTAHIFGRQHCSGSCIPEVFARQCVVVAGPARQRGAR